MARNGIFFGPILGGSKIIPLLHAGHWKKAFHSLALLADPLDPHNVLCWGCGVEENGTWVLERILKCSSEVAGRPLLKGLQPVQSLGGLGGWTAASPNLAGVELGHLPLRTLDSLPFIGLWHLLLFFW